MTGRAEPDEIEAFIDEFGLDGFPHVVDETGSIWASFGVAAQPAWIFVDADGEGELVLGGLGADALDERLAALAG